MTDLTKLSVDELLSAVIDPNPNLDFGPSDEWAEIRRRLVEGERMRGVCEMAAAFRDTQPRNYRGRLAMAAREVLNAARQQEVKRG